MTSSATSPIIPNVRSIRRHFDRFLFGRRGASETAGGPTTRLIDYIQTRRTRQPRRAARASDLAAFPRTGRGGLPLAPVEGLTHRRREGDIGVLVRESVRSATA